VGNEFGTICLEVVVAVYWMGDNIRLQIKGYFVKL